MRKDVAAKRLQRCPRSPSDLITLVIDVVSAELVTWISDLVVISASIPATIKFIELD